MDQLNTPQQHKNTNWMERSGGSTIVRGPLRKEWHRKESTIRALSPTPCIIQKSDKLDMPSQSLEAPLIDLNFPRPVQTEVVPILKENDSEEKSYTDQIDKWIKTLLPNKIDLITPTSDLNVSAPKL